MIESSLIELIALYISRNNGFINPNSIASRSNNPGLIKFYGKRRKNEYGIVEFNSRRQGINALRQRIKVAIRCGKTLKDSCFGNNRVLTELLKVLHERGFDKVERQTIVTSFLENVQLYRTIN